MRFRYKRGDGSLYDPPALTAGLGKLQVLQFDIDKVLIGS